MVTKVTRVVNSVGPMTSWKNKVVVVAGGSRGLGLAIAGAFHLRGAFLVLLARNNERLESAVGTFNSNRAGSCCGYCIDGLDEERFREVISTIRQERQGIHVMVNAIGQSTRVEFRRTTLQEYRHSMDQNFFATVTGTHAVLDGLAATDGHLVNIGSLASRTAWPFVAPYVASKHALAGFTSQLRLEGPPNVHYLFVCPGPIASLNSKPRYDLSSEMPEQAARPGAGAPVKLIDPDWLARKIVDACDTRKPELIIPSKTRFLFGLLQLWPRVGQALLKRIAKK